MEKGHEIWYWNVRSLYGAGSLTATARDLARNNLDVVGVQKVRWDKGGMVRAGDYSFFLMEKEMKIVIWEQDFFVHHRIVSAVNPLTPNDPYSRRTAPLTSKRCILYIYSTDTGTEYFKHGIYCPFFSPPFKMQFVS